jgi:type II secretory pathway pseudopilin PulG
MAELKSAVKASTLLEVIVAMVIILIVFTLAIGIYNNVLGRADSVKKEQVNAMTAHLISQSINERNWNDEEIRQDSITLQKTVVPYEKYTDLVLITVTALEHDKQIGQSRKIVKKAADEH